MDFIKKAAEGVSGNKDKSSSSNDKKSGDGQDYVDKGESNSRLGFIALEEDMGLTLVIAGFAAASKKAGYNIDPSTQEKITDGGRGAYEKFSGYDAPPLPRQRFSFTTLWSGTNRFVLYRSKVDSKYSN